jgi:hypothetical protein
MNIWLHSRVDVPLLGSVADLWPTALAMSWAAFLFDTTIVAWLLWPRTRPYAYAVVVLFHAAVGVLFPIGMFPWIMIVAATVFFNPSWPESVLARLRRQPRRVPNPPSIQCQWSRPAAVLFAAFFACQWLMPLRSHLLYDGDFRWHEQGMRWSWRVMVREKNGAVTYKVSLPDGRTHHVTPGEYLTRHQEREMTGQPDLILQLAHRIRDEYKARGIHGVEVRADAVASLNGRPPRPLIDPAVDLAGVEDGVAPALWILPKPDEPPARLHAKRSSWSAAF